jgi:hypothetical protein
MSIEARRIAAQYDLKIVPCSDPRKEGFEIARNAVLESCSCDWCLWIDTDEKFVGGYVLDKYLRDNAFNAYGIRQHHFACDQALPSDIPSRLFRRRPHEGRAPRFFGAIHEHPELALNEGLGPTLGLPDVHIAHVGYLWEGARQARFYRNVSLLRLDQKRYPNRLLQKFFLMRDNMHLVRYALRDNSGRVDADVRAKCNQVVDLYRAHFLGTKASVRREALEYYSEALTVLGEGFETVFQIEADKDEAKPNGVRRYRFASTDDFQAELNRAASEKAQRFDSKWW